MEDIDAFSELTPQDVLEVVESVTKDLMSGLQVSSKNHLSFLGKKYANVMWLT